METQFKKRGNAARLWHFLRKSRVWFVLGITCAFAMTGLEMVGPQIVNFTVDNLLSGNVWEPPAIVARLIDPAALVAFLQDKLWLVALAIILTGAASVLCRFCNMYFNNRGGEGLVKTIRDDLFTHIARLPQSFYAQNKTGDLIQRSTSDVEMVKNFVSEQLVPLFRVIILLIVTLSVMFMMNYKLAFVSLAFVPIVLTYSLVFRHYISKHFEACDVCEGELSSITQENLTGVRVVRAFGREKSEIEKFDQKNHEYGERNVKLSWLFTWFWIIGDFFSGMQVLAILGIGTYLCVAQGMELGDLLAFVSYNAMMLWPVRSLGRIVSDMSKAGVALGRINHILNTEPEMQEEQVEQPDYKGDIVFDGVSFAYEKDGAQILHDVSFDVKGGSVIGIMGGTGSGKSTLMGLLDRLYELEEGSITIGGVPIERIDRAELHRHVGYVLQDTYLFSGTIAENICMGTDTLDMETVKHASAVACFDGAVREFKDEYETFVGERGVTLSGGQKQRCSIARMLATKPDIMIFDDSLSAVDSETDAAIRRALKREFEGCTVILISHRVTTLSHADQIVVLDEGRVAEKGTHAELVALGGIYSRVCSMQGRDDVVSSGEVTA
jgi:ATP-binding cassette subfamily B protein